MQLKKQGLNRFSDQSKIYVIRANGMIEARNRNIFTKNIRLLPGDTVVVPRKINIQNPALKAILPVTEILSDIAFSAAALDSITNN